MLKREFAPVARSRLLFLVPLVLALPAAPLMAETRVGDTIVISQPVAGNLRAVGGSLRLDASVAGNAVLAAGSIGIKGDVGGDVSAVGGQIAFSGGAGDDLRAAGAEVSLRGFVTDQAAIVGGMVRIEEGSVIAGRAWIAAGTLEMAGQLGADLRVFARTVVISGQIQGDVEITAQDIRIDPGAVIGGRLIWHGRQAPLIADDALIFGEVGDMNAPVDELPAPAMPAVFDNWALGIAIIVAAVGIFWLSPALVERSGALFHAAPASTLVAGALAMLLSPVLILVLFVSVFGWLLGLLLLMAYVLAVLLSGLLGLLMLVQLVRFRTAAQKPVPAAGRGMDWRGLVLLALLTAVVLFMQSVPVLGTMVSLLVVLAGFGALASLVVRRSPPAA